MSTYIFAIGGTGARVLRSLTMLLAAGCKGTSAEETIIPIIIDYDTENGSTLQVQELLECYQRIHNRAYKSGDKDKELFFSTRVEKLKDISKAPGRFNKSSRFEVFLESNETCRTFAEHIGFNTINATNGTLPTRYLLEALYDNSNGVNAELELSLEKGFKGCPNIGCVVTKRLKDTEELKQFMTLVNKEDKILIIGSIFGGTGASGIPMLLDLFTDTAGLPDNKIGVIAVEPYFKVHSDSASVINSATFEAKTKAALEAYDLGTSVNKQADAIYYVGDNKSGALNNFEGGKEQCNPAHVAELIASICAIDFMNNGSIQHTDTSSPAMFFETWLNLPTERDEDDGDAEEEEVKTIRVSDFYEKELEEPYIAAISRLAIFNEFCKNYYLGCGDGNNNDVWLRNTKLSAESGFRSDIREFIKAFELWIEEMEENKRSLKLFDLSDNDYTKLLVDKVMTRSKITVRGYGLLSRNALSDKNICKQLGGKYNALDTNPTEKAKLEGRPCYLYLKWMTEVVNYYYDVIQEWTKEKAAGN